MGNSAEKSVEVRTSPDKCGCECEVFSRIVGYYRPVQQWNKGKQAEFKQRKAYNLSRTLRERPGNDTAPREGAQNQGQED